MLLSVWILCWSRQGIKARLAKDRGQRNNRGGKGDGKKDRKEGDDKNRHAGFSTAASVTKHTQMIHST